MQGQGALILPNVFSFGQYLIYFWSNEGNEPIHVHVSVKRPSKLSAKFWLLSDGTIELANNHAGFSQHEIKGITEFLVANETAIVERWQEYFVVDRPKYYK